jgi:uncharacterized protein
MGELYPMATDRTVPRSRTALLDALRQLDVERVASGLTANPELLDYRDNRGRNWLHLCAGIEGTPANRTRAVEMAKALLDAGLDLNAPAFREGTWEATPLWFAVARGRNLPLVRFLLERGASPQHCLWAAAYADDRDMLHRLIEAGADLDAVAEDETPLLHAVKYSRFESASILLDAGSDPDFQDSSGMTALHYMLKKGSAMHHYDMFVQHGARGDIPNGQGRTAADILARKRDVRFHDIARQLKGKL